MESDDDVPHLSAETFNALQEFYHEQAELEYRLSAPTEIPTNFKENWQLSQFWYDDHTISNLVSITLSAIKPKSKIALVSCPSLYTKLKEASRELQHEITLFEYDQRFGAFGSDFILYDYRSPLNIPKDKAGYYDIVLADPPFLSEECLTKTAVTIKFLAKKHILICTGQIMAELVQKLLDLQVASFQPKHKNNLANEFCCFTNFKID